MDRNRNTKRCGMALILSCFTIFVSALTNVSEVHAIGSNDFHERIGTICSNKSYYNEHYGVLRSNGTLWDANRKKKLASKVKTFWFDDLFVHGGKTCRSQTNGYLMLKKNGNLYFVDFVHGKSKKIMKGVKDLPDHIGGEHYDETPYPIVKRNGKLYMLTVYASKIKQKYIMSNVSKAYMRLEEKTDRCSYYVLKKDGSLWGWGSNSYGQMGNGSRKYVKKPIKIMKGVKSFDITYDFLNTYSMVCLALDNNDKLYGWGSNNGDGLSESYKDYFTKPYFIMDNVKYFGKNDDYYGRTFLAIKQDGSLWLWGNKRYGYLVDGQEDNFHQNIAQNVLMADTNGESVCYLTNDKKAYMIKEYDSIKNRKLIARNVNTITSYLNNYYFIKSNGDLYRRVGNKNKKIFNKMK